MLVIALGEILVVVLLRPLRFLFGGDRTFAGRGIHRVEEWLLRQLHVMGAESVMRHELEMHGEASGFLADSLTDNTSLAPSTSDAIERARRQTGADVEASQRSDEFHRAAEFGRGRRQVESRGGDRTADIHEAMLEAQRRQNQAAERSRRRRSSWSNRSD